MLNVKLFGGFETDNKIKLVGPCKPVHPEQVNDPE